VYVYEDGDSAAAMPNKYNESLVESKEIFDLLKNQKKTENADHPPPYIDIKTNEPSPTVKLHYYKKAKNDDNIW
jgi:hypothetical protein